MAAKAPSQALSNLVRQTENLNEDGGNQPGPDRGSVDVSDEEEPQISSSDSSKVEDPSPKVVQRERSSSMLLRNDSSAIGLSFGATKTQAQKMKNVENLAQNRSPTERYTEKQVAKQPISIQFNQPESEIEQMNVADLEQFLENEQQQRTKEVEEDKQASTGVFNNELMTFNKQNHGYRQDLEDQGPLNLDLPASGFAAFSLGGNQNDQSEPQNQEVINSRNLQNEADQNIFGALQKAGLQPYQSLKSDAPCGNKSALNLSGKAIELESSGNLSFLTVSFCNLTNLEAIL